MINTEKMGHINTSNESASFFDLAVKLLDNLPQRSQEVVKKRYGLIGEKSQTLEKIGQDYNITRERVRQIIADAIKKISKKKEKDIFFKEAEEKIILAINKNSGIIKEERILDQLGQGDSREANSVKFFADCSDKIAIIEEKGLIKKSWAVSKSVLPKVREISSLAENILNKEKKSLTGGEIAEKIIYQAKNLAADEALHYLEVLSGIEKNKFGRWGISSWMEINPKGTRERIYLVLKEEKKPLHFTQIAKLIDKFGLGKRKSHPQTVHNELIKDDRFVLIGRGIYALREWGYKQGTIKDVLTDILRRNAKALAKEDIISEVAKVRQVKKATIMINLNNKEQFIRTDGKYSLKEK